MGVRADDSDELTLEEFITVEEHVVRKPSTGSRDQTGTEVLESQSQRLGVVAGDFRLGLRNRELLAGCFHLEVTIVDQPESTEGGDGEGNTVSPLGSQGRVRRVPAAVVKTEEEDDQKGLVEELAPALHQKGAGHFAATMQPIFLGGDFTRSHGVFHPTGGCHRVFASYTYRLVDRMIDIYMYVYICISDDNRGTWILPTPTP